MKNWMWLALMLSAQCAGPALAQDIGRPATIGAPKVPQTHSVEQADDKLRQARKDRDIAENAYYEAEVVCYKKFFVNRCLDQAKETRRARLAELKAIENEANYFKRRQAVEMRDRELEGRAQKDAAEEAQRAAKATVERKEPADRPAPKQAAISLDQREAEHAAKEKQRVAKEAAEAPKRAANVADYEKKKAESEKRQAEVAKKKADKEERRKRRAAADAAKAAKAAPPQPPAPAK